MRMRAEYRCNLRRSALLTGCLLAHRTWVYRLGDCQPGGVLRIDADTDRSDLGTLLTDSRIVEGVINTKEFSLREDDIRADLSPIFQRYGF